MAISVDSVYKTVLLILNKEQRGYLTPEEFNKIGSQVQREIFERYFDDLNQQLRVPQPDVDYADRVINLDEKIEPFRKEALAITRQAGPPVYYELPNDLYRLGSVTFQPLQPLPGIGTSRDQLSTEMQRVDRTDFYHFRKSPLITPSEKYPIYLYESNKIYVYPDSINVKTGLGTPTGQVNVQYIKKPEDINWAYTIGSVGQFQFNNNYPPSVDFELNNSERVNVILNILMYTGVVIRDPQIVQAAVGQIQQEIVNSKQ
tara:strand:- start:7667 stop:8443 length:777 start_codon:yes stop_codon:yes gene_type:complete